MEQQICWCFICHKDFTRNQITGYFFPEGNSGNTHFCGLFSEEVSPLAQVSVFFDNESYEE
jgi:hypothetical protein